MVADNGTLPKVILIAGASGSGKSTLIREFLAARLPRDLAAFFPEVARSWPLVSGNEVARAGLPVPTPNKSVPAGLIVHYDIMRVVTRGYDDHRDDPAIRALLAARAPMVVVTLAPGRETLFEQFLKRVRTDQYDEPWETGNWTRRFKRRLRRLRQRLTGARPIILAETHVLLLAIYGSERRFAHWSARWNSFIEALAQERDDVSLISVEPVATQDGAPSFKPVMAAPDAGWQATAC